ncbi:alpha/beta-hydrolase [Gigaspora margarita]|uniref:Alpha/beta-hydrolase n=1 Tax=Gigaspora margarita TaxID=4874 RepID=A0A8H3X4B4_GIGMA|nr:alpha/beta-hydrolase [Gigaspora margarita]
MENDLRKLYWLFVFFISFIPFSGVLYGIIYDNNHVYRISLNGVTIVFALGLAISLWFHFCKCFVPVAVKILSGTSKGLEPISKFLIETRFIGPFISLCIRTIFFCWFIILLISDVFVRAIFSRLAGLHKGTNHRYSPVGAANTNFQPLGLFENIEDKNTTKLNGLQYSQKIALSLASAAKLAFEDVPIIAYELKIAGYDMKTFKPIAYKNICGYICEKDNNIILVFRGSNPLNIQNSLTDIRSFLRKIESSVKGDMGLVHEGFYEAMGEPTDIDDELFYSKSQTTIELHNTSLVKIVETTFKAIKTLIIFLFESISTHVYDPIDHRYLGEDERYSSAYSQATRRITDLCQSGQDDNKNDDLVYKNRKDINEQSIIQRKLTRESCKKRLFITGHSLGGGLALVFLAKLIQHDSPLLNILSGVYTYGQPNVGDIEFAKSYGPDISKKIFLHVYDNDIVCRIPPWAPYVGPPGNLIFMDSSYSISIYPVTNLSIPIRTVRKISFIQLSGILNLNVIRRMINESWLRITFRFIFPFFINDHFPGEYTNAIREGKIERIILGIDEIENLY